MNNELYTKTCDLHKLSQKRHKMRKKFKILLNYHDKNDTFVFTFKSKQMRSIGWQFSFILVNNFRMQIEVTNKTVRPCLLLLAEAILSFAAEIRKLSSSICKLNILACCYLPLFLTEHKLKPILSN